MNPDLIEIIRSTRAMRRLKPDPVPPELINQILRAGTAAPPASNMYGWRFLVIRDQAIKDAVADRYRRRWYNESLLSVTQRQVAIVITKC